MSNSTTIISLVNKKRYRPAGYRVPKEGEIYVAKDGRVRTSIGMATDDVRLILREKEGK
jgi:hypothetical protein